MQLELFPLQASKAPFTFRVITVAFVSSLQQCMISNFCSTYLSILISKTIFVHGEDLAKELQSAKITATGAVRSLRSAELLISVL